MPANWITILRTASETRRRLAERMPVGLVSTSEVSEGMSWDFLSRRIVTGKSARLWVNEGDQERREILRPVNGPLDDDALCAGDGWYGGEGCVSLRFAVFGRQPGQQAVLREVNEFSLRIWMLGWRAPFLVRRVRHPEMRITCGGEAR